MEGLRNDLYADPAIYDILHTPGTAAEVDALERIERWWAGRRGVDLASDRLWLEPACGTGRYLRVAKGRGRRIAGYDRDERLLEYARARLTRNCPPGADPDALVVADMTDGSIPGLVTGHVDFAFNPVNTLRLLGSDRAVLAHFEQIARLLKPGALYVIGLSLTNYHWLEPEEDLWESRRGGCHVSQLVNYLPPEPGTRRGRTEQVISHLTVTRPRGVEHFDDAYDLRCYDEKQWQQLVGRSALRRIDSFDAFGRTLGSRTLPYQLEALGKK